MELANQRTELLLGNHAVQRLSQASVMVVGIGGVGSYCAEGLARCGVGTIHLVDKDLISPSNLNRQIHASYDTIGKDKCDMMKQRILSYQKECQVITHSLFYDGSQNEELFEKPIDFVVDAIDTISAKLELIRYCLSHDIPFISSMGMANRLDPTKIIITDLMKTTYDPLAKVMRSQVRKQNIKGRIPVICSLEQPIKQNQIVDDLGKTRKERIPPASSPFVPSAAGLAAASYAIRILCEAKQAPYSIEGRLGSMDQGRKRR